MELGRTKELNFSFQGLSLPIPHTHLSGHRPGGASLQGEILNIQQRTIPSGFSLQSGTPAKLADFQSYDKIRQSKLFEED